MHKNICEFTDVNEIVNKILSISTNMAGVWIYGVFQKYKIKRIFDHIFSFAWDLIDAK